MDVRMLAVALLFVTWAVPAQQVYKCIDGKDIAYQSAPCANGTAEKAWDARPVPEASPAEQLRLHRIGQELAARNPRVSPRRQDAGTRTGVRDPSGSGSCASVKAQRDAAYQRVGLKRSFEFSSAWDSRVQQACR